MKAFLLRYWKVIALAAVLTAAFFYHSHKVSQAYTDGIAYQKNEQAKADKLRSEELQAEKERIEKDAKDKIKAAEAAAAKSASSRDGLRQELDRIKRIAESNTGLVSPGSTARDAVILLADMLGQCSERYQRMAEFADKAHGQGQRCETSYNSLRTTNK